jgi:hypothetical protein
VEPETLHFKGTDVVNLTNDTLWTSTASTDVNVTQRPNIQAGRLWPSTRRIEPHHHCADGLQCDRGIGGRGADIMNV